MRAILAFAPTILAACVAENPSASISEQQKLAWEVAQTQRAILLSEPVEVTYVSSGDSPSSEVKLEIPDDTGSELDVRNSFEMLSIHGGNWQYPTIAVFSRRVSPNSEHGKPSEVGIAKWTSIYSCPNLDSELREFQIALNHRFDLFSLNEPKGGTVWDGDFYILTARGYFRGRGNLGVLRLSAMDGSPVATQMERSLERLKGCWRDLP